MTIWRRLDLTGADPDGPVLFHDDISPASLFEAYQCGLYPFPTDTVRHRVLREIRFAGRVFTLGRDPYSVAWYSPDPRPVIMVDHAKVQRSLRQQLRKVEWTTTLDACFGQVVEACRAGREPRWLTDELVVTMHRLHRSGQAHSVEVWDGDELIGGTFGLLVGPVFSADSQFSTRSGAAKVAVADLVRRVRDGGGIAIDVQQDNPHARLLGARPIPRSDYLAILRSPNECTLPADAYPARRLCD